MVLYECFYLKHHLNRKNVCDATEDDVEIEEIKKNYGFETEQIAPKCSKLLQNCSKLLQNCSK